MIKWYKIFYQLHNMYSILNLKYLENIVLFLIILNRMKKIIKLDLLG